MWFVADLTVRIKVIGMYFITWHAYITTELHEEANNLSI